MGCRTIWLTDEQTRDKVRGLIWLGTTVVRGTRNFEPSCGICQFPQNFYIFVEFCGI